MVQGKSEQQNEPQINLQLLIFLGDQMQESRGFVL